MIPIVCKNCHRKFEVRDELVGTSVLCPNCNFDQFAMTTEMRSRNYRAKIATEKDHAARSASMRNVQAFWLGFLLNVLGVMIAAGFGQKSCIKFAVYGLLANALIGAIIAALLR